MAPFILNMLADVACRDAPRLSHQNGAMRGVYHRAGQRPDPVAYCALRGLACFLRATGASSTLLIGPEAPDGLDQALDRRREHEIRDARGRLSCARPHRS